MPGFLPVRHGLNFFPQSLQVGAFLPYLTALPAEVFADGIEGLVFDARSGDTHHLTPGTWLVFNALRERPLSFDELRREVDAAIELDGETADALTRRIVDELQRMRLITSMSPQIQR